MKSRDLINISIFIASAWIFGASLSCPDNITHKSSKNSNHQSDLSRLSKKISNDNKLAREISRNNNLAPGKSIMSYNRRHNIDKKAEMAEKLVNGGIPYRNFTTHFANYFTNKENRVKQVFSRKLPSSAYSTTNKETDFSLNSEFKPKQFSNKFTGEIEEFSNDAKQISRNDKMTFQNAKSNRIKSNMWQRIKRKHIKKLKENLRVSNKQHQLVTKTHNLHRREAPSNNVQNDKTELKIVPNEHANHNSPDMQEVKIATVLPLNDHHPFSIKKVGPAIELAIDKMNPFIAHHNRYLSVRFRDSKCDIADGINECINFYVKKEMHVLFGPCCDYTVAPCARQVVYWNVPMITAGGLAGDFGLGKGSMYSTMTRVGSNFNTLVQFFVDVLDYYKWKKLKLVYDPYGQTNISTKFCHIAANDIHYGLREIHQSKNITQSYVKFEHPEKFPSDFEQQIGLECAGKSYV